MDDEGKAQALQPEGVPTGDEVSTAEARTRRQTATRPARRIDDVARTRLGSQLRAMYDQIAQQPVPDHFRDLIARLEASETPAAAGSAAGKED